MLGNCDNCGCLTNLELHHRVFKSKCPAMKDSKLNHIHLCYECHRGTHGVHGKYGHKLDVKCKLGLQQKLEQFLMAELLTKEQIKDVLEITPKNVERLVKPLINIKGLYRREDIIRAAMGGKTL